MEGQLLKAETLKVLKDTLNQSFDNPKNWVLTWFDEELKKVFGVDIYEFPFNFSKGYTIIKSKKISILTMKLERLDQCFQEAISLFLDMKDLKLLKQNMTEQKFYYDTYKYIQSNITFDEEFCEKVYSSKFARHFYSPAEIESFIAKWTRK